MARHNDIAIPTSVIDTDTVNFHLPFSPSPGSPASRRSFLGTGARVAVAGATLHLVPPAFAAPQVERALAFKHLHTGEKLSVVYAVGNDYLPEALTGLNGLLRDHYSGAVGAMDPHLFDLLFQVRQALGTVRPFEVISGFRAPATNAALKASGGGGVATHSLHMEGRAIDVRITGVGLATLRDAALSLGGGGVGFYARDGFVHLDTGRVRTWQG